MLLQAVCSCREDAVVDVALANGYANHETFSRAFRRYHGVPPSAYASALWQKPGARQSVGGEGQRYRLSASRRCRLRSASILTKRHTGPYESVPRALWSELQRVARIQGVVTSSLVGIGWDDPGTTAPEALRFDAGLVVQKRVTADAPYEMGRLPGGDYAVTLHVGPHATLTDAYPEIGRQVGELPGVRFREGAVVEMYHGELLGEVSVWSLLRFICRLGLNSKSVWLRSQSLGFRSWALPAPIAHSA